jgi:uncharacterized membrane protein
MASTPRKDFERRVSVLRNSKRSRRAFGMRTVTVTSDMRAISAIGAFVHKLAKLAAYRKFPFKNATKESVPLLSVARAKQKEACLFLVSTFGGRTTQKLEVVSSV